MSEVLSLADAERLAERVLAAIDSPRYRRVLYDDILETDRERVASDIEGLRDCYDLDEFYWSRGWSKHARRFSDNLRRTARIYHVEETS